MSEVVQIAIITSSSALLGGLVGYIASMIQANIAHNRQQEMEEDRRDWYLEDISRERRLSALYRRLDQAEEFIGSVNDDFHNLRHDVLFILNTDDTNAIRSRIEGYATWRDSLPRRIYAYGPSVRSLSSENLVKSWEQLYKSFELMRDFCVEVYKGKEIDPTAQPNIDDDLKTINDIYVKFNEGLGLFIAELDSIRAGISIKIKNEGA